MPRFMNGTSCSIAAIQHKHHSAVIINNIWFLPVRISICVRSADFIYKFNSIFCKVGVIYYIHCYIIFANFSCIKRFD